ncbi:hypothetical protein GCM10007897_24370 [Sphingobium jiangsuense]|uniref:YspA cpYpsA-related SLOG domain-containing protein n=1 Tax=Sphingobium jiangsuense TaxID=870476 RepID=A0A7W6FS20_9SPHN|nr:DUF2493 domain-containing protein [Sphingobium jiangsuense]MBB3928588.1 hypothetical protein [Sphingobium jiangsuense]GLT01046.1 hypothetical protein GCM10007897_24370 [Sphingobium jiangsuense]
MSKNTATRTISSFSDLPELYAELIATDDFTASFGDPVALSIFEPGEELDDYDMPDPLACQADCAGIITTISDLLTGTRLDTVARELAWGLVNSFHFVAGNLERQEDKLAQTIGDMARRLNPSEVFNRELEETQTQCQMLTELRKTMEEMRDYAAAAYRSAFGLTWSQSRGSRVSRITTASQISALDFLRARSEKRREAHDPQGPVVVISGPGDWHDWRLIFAKLDEIKARVPHMVLVTTGQRTGVDAIAAAWAEANGAPCIAFGLYGHGKGRGFKRNRQIIKLSPVEAVLCEGSGIQQNLYELFNPERGRCVPTHVILRADQAPPTPRPRARRLAA